MLWSLALHGFQVTGPTVKSVQSFHLLLMREEKTQPCNVSVVNERRNGGEGLIPTYWKGGCQVKSVDVLSSVLT